MSTSLAEDERPPREVVAAMLHGAWVCQALSTITRLGIPDVLREHGPLTARQLTEQHKIDARAPLIERVLRACASSGIVTEDSEGRFGPTPLSAVLTKGQPMKGFAEMYGAQWWEPWGRLGDVVKGAQPRQAPWARDETGIKQFAGAMRGNVSLIPGVIEHCDLSNCRTIIDVGGGLGHMSVAILERVPDLRAVVLDLPEVVAVAERERTDGKGVTPEQMSFSAGDMFKEVPAGGDVYLISRVLHDWDDGSCMRILENCRRAMNNGGRVICLDAVLPALGDTSAASAKYLDLLMMVLLPGKERTEAEWRNLFDNAGLALTSIKLIDPVTRVSVLEASAR